MRGKRNKHRRKTGSEKRKTTAELEMFSSRYQFRAGVPVVLTRFYSALYIEESYLQTFLHSRSDFIVKDFYLNSTFTYFFLPRRSTKSSLLMSSGV